MNKVMIATDSASDLNSLFEERDIKQLPLYIMLGDEQHLDGEDISPSDIYEYYDKNKKLPITAARSPEDFFDFFKSFTDNGDSVVYISISSQISSTYEHALDAAKRLDNVHVVDGRSLSSGTGLLALAAADMRDGGADAQTIAETIEKRKTCVQASFVVNTLDYLYKGGRCSGLAAFFGKALSIKPSLQLLDGNIKVVRKYLGSFEKNILKYVDNTLAAYDTPDMTRIFNTHTSAPADIVKAIRTKLIEYGFAPENIHETIAGSTITSHCGKSTLGILYINDGNKND